MTDIVVKQTADLKKKKLLKKCFAKFKKTVKLAKSIVIYSMLAFLNQLISKTVIKHQKCYRNVS